MMWVAAWIAVSFVAGPVIGKVLKAQVRPAGGGCSMTRRLTDAEFVAALEGLFVEDILAMPAGELRAEIIAEGGDPDAIEAECRAGLERAIRECEAARAAEKTPAARLPAVCSFG